MVMCCVQPFVAPWAADGHAAVLLFVFLMAVLRLRPRECATCGKSAAANSNIAA